MTTPEPLWSDERIEDFANAKYDASEYFEVFGAMVIVRDSYEAELAIAQQRIAELEALLEGHRAAATEWVPLPDDIYNTDGPEVIYVKGQLLSIVGETYVYLPANMRLCRRVATGEATP